MSIRIQAIYILGVALHGELLRRRIHTIGLNEEKLVRIWEETMDKYKKMVAEGQLEGVPASLAKDINWELEDSL